MSGETQANALVRRRESVGLVLADGDRFAGLDRLEVRSDLVDAEVLAGPAVVGDFDVEAVITLDG